MKKQMVTNMDAKAEESLRQEISVLKRLYHPNVIQVYGITKPKDERMVIVLEYFEEKSLYYTLHEKKIRFPLNRKIEIAFDIANGINYLHHLNPKIIHRDLKSSNVLLNTHGRAIVTDFGLTKMKTETLKVTNAVRTPQWMAPEMLDEEEGMINEKVDVYSFGMVLYEIVTSLLPFSGLTPIQVIRALDKNQRPPIPDDCENSLKSLIGECWIQSPLKRPSMISKLEHQGKSTNE